MKDFGRTATLVLVIGLVLSFASSQEHAGHDPFEGATVEALSSFVPPQAPEHALMLLRITLEPGAEIPAHGHPGAVALTVQSGTFATNFTRGSGQITRAAAAGAEAQVEEAATGADVVLEAGDSLTYNGEEASHTMANGGEEPVVLLIAALLASGEEGFQFE